MEPGTPGTHPVCSHLKQEVGRGKTSREVIVPAFSLGAEVKREEGRSLPLGMPQQESQNVLS